jgi:lysophospholipase L1-like esterase
MERIVPATCRERTALRRRYSPETYCRCPESEILMSLMDPSREPPRVVKALERTVTAVVAGCLVGATVIPHCEAATSAANGDAPWMATWAAVQQPPLPGSVENFKAESLRLPVHVSAGGRRVRILLSNQYGDRPLVIGAAHIARRTAGADIDTKSDRPLMFAGRTTVTIPAGGSIQSDPADLTVPALADLAVTLYLPEGAAATTVHVLAQQTSYVSGGDATTQAHFPVSRKLDTRPFLSRVDVANGPAGYAVVAFGDSLVDGDGSTVDANHRWTDALAARLQQSGLNVSVLNAGLIGNRLLQNSPSDSQFGTALGSSGLHRFEQDALAQPGAKVTIVRIGSNDLGFPNKLAPKSEAADSGALIAGYRQLIGAAHRHGQAVIGTTMPPFENADLPGYYTPARDATRQQVNGWIRTAGEFDAVVDFDAILKDPAHPARLLPRYDSGDHLHPNDAGYAALAAAVPLPLMDKLARATGPEGAEEPRNAASARPTKPGRTS